MSLLVCKDVTKNFGGLAAISQLNLEVERGDLVGIIGPNGAGKTTLFNLISGFLPLSSGTIFLEGMNITKLQAHMIAAQKLVRTFQKINIFGDLPVWENVIIGSHLHVKNNFIKMLLASRVGRKEQKDLREKAREYLATVGLSKWENHLARSLPLGLQRALGIAVALATEPKILLLDEPASGMTPSETDQIMELIRKIHRTGVTVLLVEHDMKVVMNLCHRLVVLDFGQLIADGTPEEIKRDPRVIQIYLGKRHKNATAS